MTKTIMLKGTASQVGKNIPATALGRIFRQDGYRVASFIAQNRVLNFSMTKSGGGVLNCCTMADRK